MADAFQVLERRYIAVCAERDAYHRERDTAAELAGKWRAELESTLLKLDEYEHRAKLHMDRCQHDMERIVALEQQNEALASRLDCARRLAHSWIDTPFTSMDRDTMRTLGNELLRTIGEKWIAESNPGSAVEKPVHPRYTRCPGTIDGEHQWERWENESTGETGMECAVCHDGYPTLSE